MKPLSKMHKRLLASQEKRLGFKSLVDQPEIQEGYYDSTRGWVGPNKPDKGKRLGSCNVTACQRPGAFWYNKVMDAWYCTGCAREINYHPLDDGSYLCSIDEDAKTEYYSKLGIDIHR